MAGFGRTGITRWAWHSLMGDQPTTHFADPWPLIKVSLTVLVLSNIVSNVPLILLMAPDILTIPDKGDITLWNREMRDESFITNKLICLTCTVNASHQS